MAKRRRGRAKKKHKSQSKKSAQLTTSRYTNVPRFLIMLTVGLVALLIFYFWVATRGGQTQQPRPGALAPATEDSAPAPAAP